MRRDSFIVELTVKDQGRSPYSKKLTPNMLPVLFTSIHSRITVSCNINLLKPTGHVMHQQFNIQQLYVLPTLYLCVLYLAENKQRLVPLTAQTDWFL